MSILARLSSPADVRALRPDELPVLAEEVRAEILSAVSQNGGHLAGSLGAVELTIALLRVFDPPKDKIVWDVGHQAYAWKILTDRRARFGTLRRRGGLSGFPDPDESPFDAFVAGHAGVALAAAEGFAAAAERLGRDETAVAVIGDGSLTNGGNLEALNNASSLAKKVILVVNDNEMSIGRNVGAFTRVFARLISGIRYNRVRAAAERAGHRLPILHAFYHRVRQMVKSFLPKNGLFETYGFRYIGPVDGHDPSAVEAALRAAKEGLRSAAVHVVTVKGKGFRPAERKPSKWHGTGPFPLADAEAPASGRATWTDCAGAALVDCAKSDDRVCALTAAMRDGTGLAPFAEAFPDRFFDAGICESNVVTFAAGLARAGFRPVVALYSTFLQRAVDQVFHDVALQHLPVVFLVDRAGAVGADGRTHQGLYDLALLKAVPGLRMLQPKDGAELRAMLGEALARTDGPTAIRYPRGAAPEGDVCVRSDPDAPWQLWALGDEVPKANRTAEMLASRGIRAGVVYARAVKPFDAALLARQRAAGMKIASFENASVAGGFGESIGADLRFGWPDAFLPHGSTAELEKDFAFTAEDAAERIVNHG